MIDQLNEICFVEEHAKIKNTFKLESICFAMIKPKNEEELIKVINVIKEYNYKYIVLGNASNVILPSYYDGIVINLSNFNKYEIKDESLYVEAGCMINKISNDLVNLGYSGLDFACGIPGTIGGSIYGNAGCYGSSISDVLISVRVFNGEKVVELSNKELKFDYRYSMLKEHKDYIVLSAIFKIEKSNVLELKALVKERNEKRMSSQDLTHPSNGSVFRNPEGTSAGKLIDDLGLKGFSVGDKMVRYKHDNFIINNGKTTKEDIVKLINVIKEKVKKEYDIDLTLEQEIIE